VFTVGDMATGDDSLWYLTASNQVVNYFVQIQFMVIGATVADDEKKKPNSLQICRSLHIQ
jgi:hypothetical protein